MKTRINEVLFMGLLIGQISLAAQSGDLETRVITMTRLPKPWYAPNFLVQSKMIDSIPEYASIPGLKRKIYSIESDSGLFGGIYLWENRKAAENWFTPAWFDRVNKKYGGENQVPILIAIFIYNQESKEIDTTEHWATVHILQIDPMSQKDLAKHFESKIPFLQKQKGFLSLWVAEESSSQIRVITLWSDKSSFLDASFSSFGLPNWKSVESIQTKSPILLSNK